MRQLHILLKLDIGLFVDFCVFTSFLHDVIIKLFCFDLQINKYYDHTMQNW